MATWNPSTSTTLPRIYAWFSAILKADIALMADLLAHGVPVDVLHPLRHSTALMEAARFGRTEMVAWLLAHDADPDMLCGRPKGTALHGALRRQHYDAAQALVIVMAHCAATDEYGATALHTLCIDLPEDGGDAPRSLAGACIAKGCPLDALDHEGATALHYCAINDAVAMADILLAAGANPNAATPDGGVSPLMIAALEKNHAMAQTLLLYGADIYHRTREGSSPASVFPAIRELQVARPPTPRIRALVDG